MSKGNVNQIMCRINGATPASQIAVFRTDVSGQLNGVFADTVVTRRLIADKEPSFIGSFDATMDLAAIQKMLSESC